MDVRCTEVVAGMVVCNDLRVLVRIWLLRCYGDLLDW